MNYIGRLAPSPTGAQHVGNARTFLVAWLASRVAGGRLLLRIEDLDTPRTKKGAREQAIEDLRWLGLDWDKSADGVEFTTQSDRESRYREVLKTFQQSELIYPCTCTRSEIEAVASAPHEWILDGVIYPGTCSFRTSGDALDLEHRNIPFAWRFRIPDGEQSFVDQKHGLLTLDAKQNLGDFIVARSSGVTAYQLAVVVDDHDFGINHVVRGNDLIYSTFRQIAIYESLGWATPHWLHVPLVVGPDGKRLAKRHGDSRLSAYREQGIAPETILGYLASTLGLVAENQSLNSKDILQLAMQTPNWISRMPESNVTFSGKFWTL